MCDQLMHVTSFHPTSCPFILITGFVVVTTTFHCNLFSNLSDQNDLIALLVKRVDLKYGDVRELGVKFAIFLNHWHMLFLYENICIFQSFWTKFPTRRRSSPIEQTQTYYGRKTYTFFKTSNYFLLPLPIHQSFSHFGSRMRKTTLTNGQPR